MSGTPNKLLQVINYLPKINSSQNVREVLEHCAGLMSDLVQADFVVAFVKEEGSVATSRVEDTRLLESLEPSDLLSVFKDNSDFVRLEDHELRSMMSAVSEGTFGVALALRNLGELCGALLIARATAFTDTEIDLLSQAGPALSSQIILFCRQQEQIYAKTEFWASLSHEIRSPLGVMLGFAELALDSGSLPATIRDYIVGIRRNGQQLSEILGETLDLAKIDVRRMEIEALRFPFLPFLNEVVSFMDLSAREKLLQLILVKNGPLPRVIKSDPTRLRQILNNLIGNAIKFTDHGSVKLSVEVISALKPGMDLILQFAVEDTGVGIPDELKGRLFQPFVQLDSSVSRRYGGSGLGLSLAKQLCHVLGGDLWLERSAVGAGSRFCLRVNVGPFEGEMVLDGKSPGAPHVDEVSALNLDVEQFHGKKVLLVEDSEDNQLLISRYLSAVGIDVDLASNGEEGILKAQNGAYDLVVMDIQMPGLDGFEAARTLRDNGYARPIIALTAHAFKEDRDKAFRSGFNEYLTKPVNRSVLLKTLHQRFETGGLH